MENWDRLKKELFTIPNILSIIRIILIPVFSYLYVIKKAYFAATVLIILSGISDLLDGYIARSFDMITDLGKLLDPLADKLTQLAVLLILTSRFEKIKYLIGFFLTKEILMGITGYKSVKKSKVVNSAKWHGKLNSVVLYFTLLVHLLWFNIGEKVSNSLLVLAIFTMSMSLVLYLRDYMGIIIRSNKKSSV